MSPSVPLLARIDHVQGALSCDDFWSHETYARARREIIQQVIALKRARRVALGEHCSLVFETRASVWFQIQEELHLHTGDRPAKLAQLLGDYGGLVPTPGELRATLFLECYETSLARVLSLHLADHITALSVDLPIGRFNAQGLEPLAHGIPGVAFLRFVLAAGKAEAPLLRWPVPDYMVVSMLPNGLAQALSLGLAKGRS